MKSFFPLAPKKPNKADYLERIQKITVSKMVWRLDYDDCADCESSQCAEYNCKIPNISNGEDLQKMLSSLSSDITPNQIKISLDFKTEDYNGDGESYILIKFYYETNLPDRAEEYETAINKYTLEFEEYHNKLKEIIKQNNKERIKELEEELAELKKEE